MKFVYFFLAQMKSSWSKNNFVFTAYENRMVKHLFLLLRKEGLLLHSSRRFTEKRFKKIRKKKSVYTSKYRQFYFKTFPVWEYPHLQVRRVIKHIEIMSRSRPQTIQLWELKKQVNWNNLYILSTPLGLLSGQQAIQQGTGGVILAILYL